MNLRSAATFPCNPDKSPIPRRGFKDAIRGVDWRKAPLVGFPTGAVNGIDVLDIDGDAGREWYDVNFDAIPATRAHSTRRGMHLLFVHAPGLRCTVGKIAPGIDVRTEGGYVIWWPREGLPVEDNPICDWPDWLREEAMNAQRSKVYPSSSTKNSVEVVKVSGATEALRKLDPCAWRGEHDDWFALLMGAKAAGIACEDFVEWSIGDPEYADDAEIIRVKWNSIGPRHPGAFLRALKDAGIKLKQENKRRTAGVHISAGNREPRAISAGIKGNLQSRTSGLITWLSRNATADGLFSAACLFAELGLTQDVAAKLVKGNLPTLRRALGNAEFTRQIARGFEHIECKSKQA